MFAEVVHKIVDLLRDQVAGIERKTGSRPKVCQFDNNRNARSLLAERKYTGHHPSWGFGENRYLLKQLESQFPGITIQQPRRAWSAVCRGAVYQGLNGGDQIVANHISKYYYGLYHHKRWVDGQFNLEDKYFNEREQVHEAKRQITWYLKKVSYFWKYLEIY
jgi:hypothetical protein